MKTPLIIPFYSGFHVFCALHFFCFQFSLLFFSILSKQIWRNRHDLSDSCSFPIKSGLMPVRDKPVANELRLQVERKLRDKKLIMQCFVEGLKLFWA